MPNSQTSAEPVDPGAGLPHLERRGDVFVLWLVGPEAIGDGSADDDARFHPDWIDAAHAALDEVEAAEGPAALVTANDGKFYSNGLDLEYILPRMDELDSYLERVHTVYRRLLAFEAPTVAAVQGHAFGAGAMLATAQDFRVMRADKGYYCLPEVTMQMPFTPGMSALMTHRLPKQVALEAMTAGRRFGGNEALAAGIVDAVVDGGDGGDGARARTAVLDAAVDKAQGLAALRGRNLAGIKRGIHAELLAVLDQKVTGTTVGD